MRVILRGYGVFSSRIQQEITRTLHFISKQRLEIDPYTEDLNFLINSAKMTIFFRLD